MDLYLYGDHADTFVAVTRPFVAAARRGGGDGTVAVLMQGGADSARYLRDYRRSLLAAGAEEVTAVFSDPGGRVDEAGIEVIGSCSGIFMAGGHVPTYHRAFVASPAGAVIRSQVAAGVPFAGVSAGALLATTETILTGDRAAAEQGGHRLLAVEFEHTGGPIDLGAGLGLIDNTLVEPHFTAFGGFPRLLAGMQIAGTRFGVGIDEPAGVEITNGRLSVLGEGRVYLLRRSGSGTITVEVWAPGESFPFP